MEFVRLIQSIDFAVFQNTRINGIVIYQDPSLHLSLLGFLHN